MAGRSAAAQGGVIRTYARLRPLRRIESQKWFSPGDRQHLFSSSSSHPDSTPEDPDFIPSKRKVSVFRRRGSRKPESRTLSSKRKKCLPPPGRKKRSCSAQSSSDDKENDERLHPSPPELSTPFRRFVTLRRKAPGPGVTMKPLSSKPKREAGPFRSPDSLCDFEADRLTRRRRRRVCADMSLLRSPSAEAPHTPLQTPPLHSSTPSMMLTAVPRKGNTFVRQLALSEPLEDSVVLCSADPSPCGGRPGGLTRPQETSNPAQTSTEGGKKTPRAKSSEQERFSPGCGVKRLNVTTSADRKLPSVCLLSPIVVSSPESVVFIGESASPPHDDDAFGASAELFSGNFTLDKQEPSPSRQVEREPHGGSTKGGSASDWHLRYFSRKEFQPSVRLNSRTVAEYFLQKDLLNKSAERGDGQPSGGAAPTGRMKPAVSLDSAAVSKYLLKKDPALASPALQTVTKTPQITSSVLRSKVPGVPQTGGTARKVCISGFSGKRWGTLRKKPAARTQQQLSFQDRSREDLGVGDTHSSSSLFSSSLLTTSFMNSTAVMNLNLSTDSLPGRDPHKEQQRWARLRAALSLHRKKKVEAGSPYLYPGQRRIQGKMSLSSQNSSLLLLSPFQSALCAEELTDAEKVLAECQQDNPIPFSQCLSRDQLRCGQKVGEGVYGEVFRTLRGGQHVALKVIPIEGSQKVNGENQKSFAEILPEIIISKELSLLSEAEDNQTSGFIQLHSAHCVQGSYPPELLSAWDTFAEEKGTENERPDLFGPEQLFMILEFEFGGEDLERMSSKLPSVAASRSILHQVTAALAVAEEELRFEHRDLHWGNLLIEKSASCAMSVSLQGERFAIPNAGIQVKIIDYTLSRLDKDGLTVFCDLSTDEELFLGEGDLQFDVYRKMRQENQNVWSSYKPHSNVLWLHYLCDKLLNEVKYIKKPTSAPQRRELRRLQDFRREVQQFGSATEVLKRCRLFK